MKTRVGRQVIMIGFGCLVWLIPFVISAIIFPLKTSAPPLFEKMIPVITAGAARLTRGQHT